MGYQRAVSGLSVGYQWVISGLSEGYQRVIRGLSVGYQTVISGLSVGYQRVQSINQSCISVRQDRCMFQYHCKGLYLSNWRNVLTGDVIFCTCAFYIHFLLSSVKFLVTVARDVL